MHQLVKASVSGWRGDQQVVFPSFALITHHLQEVTLHRFERN